MQKLSYFAAILVCILSNSVILNAQFESYILGQGQYQGAVVQSSDETAVGQAQSTLSECGFMPNLNAASRFLSQASLGHSLEDIEELAEMGIEDWIDDQFIKPIAFNTIDKVIEYHDYRRDSLNDQTVGQSIRFWDYAWWQYHMQSDDVLRQRVAFALSEILVISRFSGFGNESYAFSTFYDIFLNHAFGNYRDILQDVTFNPSMGEYLTYLNNPKSDITQGTFPDENYAREVMQLFTIGLEELNVDGTIVLDGNGNAIPTYDNIDISEFSKIFTGLSWWDRDIFFRGDLNDSSYMYDMQMFNDYHEPGVKNLLNGFQVPDRMPIDGVADINDALDNLFAHPNVGPFISRVLIQRLVTSNPTPAYVGRVATLFNDNGSGVKGDMKTVIKAILLDEEARDCDNIDNVNYGRLREPFIRYVQINRAFDASTLSGKYRNEMYYVQEYVEQKPFTSPSVFNFYQNDYQPIGPIEQGGFVAPEFQITNTQTMTGYINALYEWIIQENIADESDLFSGESNDGYADEISTIDISDEQMYAEDIYLHQMIDRLNLILAHGLLSPNTEQTIINAVKEFEANDADDLEMRTKLAIYLVLTSPEYLIHR
jgi:uncharacterized protein (DUF1800 family)